MGKQGRIMTFTEAMLIAEPIVTKIEKDYSVKVIIAGSLRRNRPVVGDIDLLLVTPTGYLPLGMYTLFKFASLGDKQGTVLLPGGEQIDLMACNDKDYASMLLHFTGSRYHNIKMRAQATKLGYVLNQYGLRNLSTSSGDVLSFPTEEAIFMALKMPYVKPEDRN